MTYEEIWNYFVQIVHEINNKIKMDDTDEMYYPSLLIVIFF